MSVLLVLAFFLAWFLVASVVALVIGRVVKSRDTQVPGLDASVARHPAGRAR